MSKSTTAVSKETNNEIVPNFLIVGAAKAGTTSLYEYLRQHPDIFVPNHFKEPTYFVNPLGAWKAPVCFETYLNLFKDGEGKKAIGEASTAYLASEESPEWIRSALHEVKIIIGLRNPAKRAFSHYMFNVMKGWEDADSFEKALDREPLRLKNPSHLTCRHHFPPDFFYFKNGLYFQQVKRYIDIFGKDRVMVYLFEDLVKRPLSVCREVFDFLNVDPQFVPSIAVHNEGRKPVSTTLQFWFYTKAEKLKSRTEWYSWRLFRVYRKLMIVNTFLGKKSRLSEALYDSLMAKYRSDIHQLESLLNRDLSIWL
jgi:hypothetical protein